MLKPLICQRTANALPLCGAGVLGRAVGGGRVASFVRAPKGLYAAMLPTIQPHSGRDPRRALDTPPRPRAKCVGFYAPLQTLPSRATAGLAGGKWVHENHANSCGFVQYHMQIT